MLNTDGGGVTKDNKIHIKDTRFTRPDLDRNMNSDKQETRKHRLESLRNL